MDCFKLSPDEPKEIHIHHTVRTIISPETGLPISTVPRAIKERLSSTKVGNPNIPNGSTAKARRSKQPPPPSIIITGADGLKVAPASQPSTKPQRSKPARPLVMKAFPLRPATECTPVAIFLSECKCARIVRWRKPVSLSCSTVVEDVVCLYHPYACQSFFGSEKCAVPSIANQEEKEAFLQGVEQGNLSLAMGNKQRNCSVLKSTSVGPSSVRQEQSNL